MSMQESTSDAGPGNVLVGQTWMALCKGSRPWVGCKNMGWLVQPVTTESGNAQPYMMIDLTSGKIFRIIIVEVE